LPLQLEDLDVELGELDLEVQTGVGLAGIAHGESYLLRIV
jgi:hypothetical protein